MKINNVDYEDLGSIQIQKKNLDLKLWKGLSINDTYGNKRILEYNNEPLYAELVIVQMLINENKQAVWRDNFRNKYRNKLPEKSKGIELPIEISTQINEIRKVNKSMNGCWDIISWNDKYKIHFYELKESKKDKIRLTQIEWLNTCLKLGYSKDNFTIIEWKINE